MTAGVGALLDVADLATPDSNPIPEPVEFPERRAVISDRGFEEVWDQVVDALETRFARIATGGDSRVATTEWLPALESQDRYMDCGIEQEQKRGMARVVVFFERDGPTTSFTVRSRMRTESPHPENRTGRCSSRGILEQEVLAFVLDRLSVNVESLPPAEDPGPTGVRLQAGLTQAWDVLIYAMGARSWPIDEIDRGAGHVRTDWINHGLTARHMSCETQDEELDERRRTRVRLDIQETGSATVLRVMTEMNASRGWHRLDGYVACTSTGFLEEGFLAEVVSLLER